MNAGIRSKARRTWPRGLEEVRPGYFRWMPPAGVVSRYMIHHSKHHGPCKPGDRIVPRTLSDAFADARDAVGVTVEGKTPPTLHEIRSLSLRLYHEQGVDAQAIAGHKDASMTAVYRMSCGAG